MSEIRTILLLISTVCGLVSSDDPLGCGGFVKSHVPIDFSKIEVKLITSKGVLKDKITCAPNNGYYFVPIYDKGEYILQLKPPAGWSFTPTEVSLAVDGKSDLCSLGNDINFVFQGFGITGKVESLGGTSGPADVQVELKSTAETQKTYTDSNGSFFFTPVYPGTYTVSIVDSKWKLWKKSVNVVVAEGNTVLPGGSLVVQGYKVVGTVLNGNEPIKDTTILLFAASVANVKVEGCNTDPINCHFEKKPICHVKSDDRGQFTFDTVPVGKYVLAPLTNGESIIYQPKSIHISLENNDLYLTENFQLLGFTIVGRVLNKKNGTPVKNAKIYLNGELQAYTNFDGFYKIEEINGRNYRLTAEADGYKFQQENIKINPNSKQLPDLIPHSYEVCGNIVSENSQLISFINIETNNVVSTLSESGTGNFCYFLTPGKYNVQVVNGDSQDLQFYPKLLKINVFNSRVYDISFSQLKATIKGKIKCLINDCKSLNLILRQTGEYVEKNIIKISVIDNSYQVSDIFPGTYDIILLDNKLCWNVNKQTIIVNTVNIEVGDFIQTGYVVNFISSHDTEATYELHGDPFKFIKINKGRFPYCLTKPGLYNFKLIGCHVYESNMFAFNTENDVNEIYLNAQKHKISLEIKAENIGNVSAKINVDGKTEITNLTYSNGYIIDVYLSPSERAIIIPQSDLLYFTPPILSVSGSIDCENLGFKFIGNLGVVYKGKVTPPLAGVTIYIEDVNNEIIMTETDVNGHYKFSPLDKTKSYKMYAKKDSYVLSGPDKNGNFLAHKLAEISIQVLDKDDKTPLTGTLLSLSGGESYRRNLQTDDNGKITFNSLSPGEYFIRPMMKEYNFQPNSKIISVKEGETVTVELTGKKVAFSVFGDIKSLNGEPEDNIIVIAKGQKNCSQNSEESTSEMNGKFRIRGLQPFCSYVVTVKTSENEKIERSIPDNALIEITNQDVKDLKLLIFKPIVQMDVLLKINAKNLEHYKMLRIKIIRESVPNGIVYSGKIDTISLKSDYNNGILVQIPQLTIDGKLYVIQLESTNQNVKWNTEPAHFWANNSFQYFQFHLNVKRTINDQDIKQISLSTIFLMLCFILFVYKIDKITDLFKEQLGQYLSKLHTFGFIKKPLEKDYGIDNDDIDQIVESINAVKRKPKPKKL